MDHSPRDGGRGQEQRRHGGGQLHRRTKRRLPSKQDAAKLVATANTKTAEAAAKLPEDKEVADAAAKLKARAEQLAAEVATLTKAVADGPAAIQTTTVALATADQALIVATAKYEPLQARVTEIAARAKAADNQARNDGAALTAIVTKIEDAQAIVATFTFPFNGRDRKGRGGEGRRRAGDSSPGDHHLPSRNRPHQPGPRRRQQATAAANAATEQVRKEQADRKATFDAVAEAIAKTQIAQQKLPTRPSSRKPCNRSKAKQTSWPPA